MSAVVIVDVDESLAGDALLTYAFEVAADNEAAQSLYTRKGFRSLARRTGYYGPGQDAVVMRRRLDEDAA